MDACNSPAPDDTQTSAAEVIAGNTDLLTEILLRLPLKSIDEFKSVSTDWHSLITSPNFTGRRTQNPKTTLPIALLLHPTSILNRTEPEQIRFLPPPKLCFTPLNPTNNPSPSPIPSLSFVNPDSHTYICHSCNGLLICCDSMRKSFYIVNPSTSKSVKLPDPLFPTSSVLAMNLAYDPYSASAHHYKVVCIGLTFSKKLQINVYSSESKLWKLCKVKRNFKSIRPRSNMQFNSGVFLDGAIHWVLEERSSSYYFDLNSNSINKIRMPMDHQYKPIRYFGKWKDRLYLIYGGESKLYVYEMKRDYSGWGFKFDFNWDESKVKYFSIHFMYWEDKDDAREKEKALLVMHLPNKIIRYKVKDDTMEKICHIPRISLKNDPDNAGYRRYGWFDVFPYYESLACV